MEKVKAVKAIRICFTKETGRSHHVTKLSDGRVHICTFILNPISCRPDKIEFTIWETSLLSIVNAYTKALLDINAITFPTESFKLDMNSHCTWEQTGTYTIKTSCGEHIEPIDGFTFCPYFGKKVKHVRRQE